MLVDDLRIATISVHSVPASMEELVDCVRLTAVWQQFWAPWVTPLCVAVRCSLSHAEAGRKGESRVWNIDKVLVSRNSADFWKKSSERPIKLEALSHRAPTAVRGKLLTFMALLATRGEPPSRIVSPPWELLCPSCTVSYPVVCLTDGEREALCKVWWTGAYKIGKHRVVVSHIKKAFIDSLTTDRRASLNDMVGHVGDLRALSSDLRALLLVSANQPDNKLIRLCPAKKGVQVRLFFANNGAVVVPY